jgi:hypothetical protein
MDTENSLIHVRFSPDGTVVEIGERPPALTPQEWFNRLSLETTDRYQPLSGGRGLFRLSRSEIETLKGAPAA